MLKAIFFDFDGVVVESAGIKTEAFRKLFSNYHDQVDKIVDYHKANAGVSRYDKFDYIYEKILRQELTKEKKDELGKKFSELVLEEIKTCPFVLGAVDFLEKYSKKLDFFLISATPDEELKYLVKYRKLDDYFKEVHGAPHKKSEIMADVLKNEKLENQETLFIGDTISDYNHSITSGVPFIGRILGQEDNPFPDDVKTVQNFEEFGHLVEVML